MRKIIPFLLPLWIGLGSARAEIIVEARTGATEPGVVRVSQSGGNSSGVIVDEDLVLTSNHGTKRGSVRVEGRDGKVIAVDEDADLALVRVPGLDGTARPVAAEGDPDTGSATLYGFPAATYRVSPGSVDAHGNLDFKVYAGNSGGPLLKDGKVIGILVRYHGVATASQIRAFLKSANHTELYARRPAPSVKAEAGTKEAGTGLVTEPVPDRRTRPVRDAANDEQRQLEELLREFKELNRSVKKSK